MSRVVPRVSCSKAAVLSGRGRCNLVVAVSWMPFFLCLLLLFSTSAAFATDLSTEVAELSAAITARLGVIGASPTTAREAKEKAKLSKSWNKLAAYAGNNDLKDFKVLGSAAKQLYKSRTVDAAILAEAGDVLQCIRTLAETQANLAADTVTALANQVYQGRVNRIIKRAEKILGKGLALVDNNPLLAQKLLVKAWKLYGKSIAKAAKLAAKGGGGGGGSLPSGLTVFGPSRLGFALVNNSSKNYVVKDVLFTITVERAGSVVATADRASARTLRPDRFDEPFEDRIGVADPVLGGAFYDLMGFLLAIDPGSPLGARFHGSVEVQIKKYASFTVPIDVTF